MRQQTSVALVMFIASGQRIAAQDQLWNVIDNAQGGKIPSLWISGNSGGWEYQAINAMCAGKTLALAFTVARPMQKLDVFISEGGSGVWIGVEG